MYIGKSFGFQELSATFLEPVLTFLVCQMFLFEHVVAISTGEHVGRQSHVVYFIHLQWDVGWDSAGCTKYFYANNSVSWVSGEIIDYVDAYKKNRCLSTASCSASQAQGARSSTLHRF